MAAGSPKRRPGAAEAEAEEEDDNDDDGGGAGRWRRTLGRLPLQRRRGAPPPARGRQAWRAGARAPVAVAWACAALAALAGVGCRAPWATAAVAGLRPVFAMSRYDILRSKSALEIDLGAVQRKFIRYDVDAFNQDAAAIEERAQLRKRMEKLPEFGMLLRANDARLEQSSGGHEDRLSWAMHEQATPGGEYRGRRGGASGRSERVLKSWVRCLTAALAHFELDSLSAPPASRGYVGPSLNTRAAVIGVL
ncbi:unnamed protein product [Prorocentrum cordatum]|uniref:Uncharacterized protein n=1 Tax=Prorocentrum cordatum TaxID=2364126 RepID=A0ABN9UJ96_9DINO|nr:unnamed protein product [Polarella glacialis]